MGEDDIAVRGFRSYFGALGLLERGCGWDRRTAHAELMDAVNDGRVRRKSDPNPPRPKYDSGNWNERRWLPSLALSLMDLDGNWTHFPGGDGKPAFTKEEYSTADIERLVDQELSRRQETDAAEAFPPGPKTKTTIPVAELLTELRRRGTAGSIAPRWSPEAAALARWAETNLPPGTPCSASGIRGHSVLKAEYDKLGRQK